MVRTHLRPLFSRPEACCDLEKIVWSLTGSQLIVILSVVGAMSTPRVRAHPATVCGLRPAVGCAGSVRRYERAASARARPG